MRVLFNLWFYFMNYNNHLIGNEKTHYSMSFNNKKFLDLEI